MDENTGNFDEGTENLINSAMMDARRRSFLQSSICYHLINPLAYDEKEHLYNYQIAFNSMINLLIEISSKLSTEELSKCTEYKTQIQNFLDNNLIHQNLYEYDRLKGKIVVFKNWVLLREKLFDFAVLLKGLSDSHGFGSPDKKDPRKSVIET